MLSPSVSKAFEFVRSSSQLSLGHIIIQVEQESLIDSRTRISLVFGFK